MRIRTFGMVMLTAAIAAGASACNSTRNQDVLVGQVPDDFRVVARAPLIIPPEYALRPPSPGEPRPQELDPESSARAALVGRQVPADLSQGQQLLIQRAGGTNADPGIRAIIDDEQGDIAHKERNFADLVMFWRPGQPNIPTAAAGSNDSEPIDPAEEAARIASLTGNAGVVIRRDPRQEQREGFRIKLPGL